MDQSHRSSYRYHMMLGRSEKSTQKRDSIFHHPITKAVTICQKKKKKKIKGIPMNQKIKKN
jgi:hypothetical protein